MSSFGHLGAFAVSPQLHGIKIESETRKERVLVARKICLRTVSPNPRGEGQINSNEIAERGPSCEEGGSA